MVTWNDVFEFMVLWEGTTGHQAIDSPYRGTLMHLLPAVKNSRVAGDVCRHAAYVTSLLWWSCHQSRPAGGASRLSQVLATLATGAGGSAGHRSGTLAPLSDTTSLAPAKSPTTLKALLLQGAAPHAIRAPLMRSFILGAGLPWVGRSATCGSLLAACTSPRTSWLLILNPRTGMIYTTWGVHQGGHVDPTPTQKL